MLFRSDVAKAYTPKLVSINPTWGGDWNNNQGAMFNVKYENFQYSVENPIFDIKYESTDHAAGAIMTFVQVDDIFQYFPKMHAELDNLYLDGTKVTGYDATKVIDTNDGNSYRLELWNCYGDHRIRNACYRIGCSGTARHQANKIGRASCRERV